MIAPRSPAPAASTPAPAAPRSLQAIDAELLELSVRQAKVTQDELPKLRAAREAEDGKYKAARIEAARSDRQPSPRAALEGLETKIGDTQERAAGLTDAIEALKPEREAARQAEFAVKRAALLDAREGHQKAPAQAAEAEAEAQRQAAVAQVHIDDLTRQLKQLE